MKIEILVTDVQIFNSYFKTFIKGNVAIKDERFYYIGERSLETFEADQVIKGKGRYMVPGLIDIHLHIESTMVTPATFSYGLIKNGVTTIVPEPHEMANVFGITGVKEMIKASKNCLVDMFYSIPSSVPATAMETTGGSIEIADIEELLQTTNIKCLGEIMNFNEVVSEQDCKTNQILSHIRSNYPDLIIEGHVPKLLDLDLQKIIYAGVNSDHTHQTVEGMDERIGAGMFLEIQEKSMTEEVVDYFIEKQVDEHFCFVTDDVMADNFQKNGHLNRLLTKAIQLGMAPEKAIYACTYTPAQRMRMHDRGAIAPGKVADFLLVSDLEDFVIDAVYKKGALVYDCNEPYVQVVEGKQFPESFYQSVSLDALTEDDFTITIPVPDLAYTDTVEGANSNKHIVHAPDSHRKCRIINVQDGSTFTKESVAELDVSEGRLCWEESDYALIATYERYGINGNRAQGLIGGDILKRGAIATTYSHDNHNLLVIGHNPRDMMLAANEVIWNQGGICVVENEEILTILKLEVGGILSEEPLAIVAEQVE
ncbi:MAG: amidohydrolase family protein, partial [Bacillus sp. (in: Bacteria)]|nr:amidohydrolase family protein [Bacillus sp. (in: firmicutes)]